MFDFLLILFIIAMKWNEITAIEYQSEVNQHLAIVDDNMAVIWQSGEALTKELKECKKRKGRK